MALRIVSLSAAAACLVAVTASVVLHLLWPRTAPTSGVAGARMTLASASAGGDRASLVRLAESYVKLQIERQIGVTVQHQAVTRFSKRAGAVVISLHDKLADWDKKRSINVDVTLNEGAWQPLGMQVITETGGIPMGVPAPAS